MASPASVKAWDDETDVLVCGYGLAGACAAIEAHDLDPGADILVLEKMPERHQGGNSRASGQSLLISKDVEALKSYQRAKEAGARYLHGTGWSDRGVVLEFPEYGAAEAVAHSATILPVPSGVWLTFKANVERRPRIRRRFETRVVDLVQDPDTLEVFGAVVEQGGARAGRA